MAAVTTEVPPQYGKASLTLYPHAPPPPVSSPPPLSSVSPPCQHQLPIHPSPVATGSHRLPVPLHILPNLASANNPVLEQSAGDHTSTHQQRTGSFRQGPAAQQVPLASAEDHPSNGASNVFPQQGLSPDATTDQGLQAILTDSPASVPTESSHDLATAAAAAEAEQHAPGHGSGTSTLVTQTTKSQADADNVPLLAEQNCQAPLPVTVISDTDKTDAQQLLASGFTAGTGKHLTVTAHGKTRAADMLGRSTPAQTDPEHLPAVMAHAASAAKGRSPGYEAPAAVALGFTTGAGNPVNVTAKGQAEARKLFDNAAPQDLGQSAAERMPADRATPAASGFTTGTGKAVLRSAAAQAQTAQTLADVCTADKQPTAAASGPSSAAAPANAPSGFSTGTGKAVLMSAAAKAWARKVLADDSTATVEAQLPSIITAAPAVAPSGFTTGTGKAVQFSAAAKARAEKLFADDSIAAELITGAASGPASTAAPAPAPSGFTSGAGKAVPISAAAQAQARSIFQDENAAPLHPAVDIDSSMTPAGSSSRPGMKAASARPVLGTPRTGPPVSKPVMKRVKELSQSTGGKLFKKPRMSKIASPFCPGATPHRVRLD